MIGIPVIRTKLDREIEKLEDRLDWLQVQYYEENNKSVSVETMKTLETVIEVLKGNKTSNEIF